MPIWFGAPSSPPFSPHNDNRNLTRPTRLPAGFFIAFQPTTREPSNQVTNLSDHSIPFSAAMYSGPVPQQPPMIRAPASTSFLMDAANWAGIMS